MSKVSDPTAEPRHYQPLPALPPDIEIAHSTGLKPIGDVAAGAGLLPDELAPYGLTKAKVTEAAFARLADAPDGRLVLVTAMTATRAGEGKTVTSIGLAQALGKLGVRHMLALREPSLGPVFGMKGGAAGGGYAQVLPMDQINLHFTGDFHAITTAHNLLAAIVDNHIYQGNELRLDPARIVWRRAMDLCDRQLRHCDTGLGTRFDGVPRRSGFDITASSEIMAIMALAEDLTDLERRLSRILVGYRDNGEPVLAGEFDCTGAMIALLKDALQPNLVQTCENTPALVHCGPFANIAHGCNSVRATRLALKLADVVVTEAGFAADLGAEKFFSIKCRTSGLRPSMAVLVVTVRAIKMHGGVAQDALAAENLGALRSGLQNVAAHIDILRRFGVPMLVAVNRFPSDTAAELDEVFAFCETSEVPAALSEVAARGGAGGLELARKVLDIINEPTRADDGLRFVYDLADSLREKIEKTAREVYEADGVDYTAEAAAEIDRLEAMGLGQLPICMAKTQMSLSDDPAKPGRPRGWRLTVREVRPSHGAGFIVIITGRILLMPGMPQQPATSRFRVDANGTIHGLS